MNSSTTNIAFKNVSKFYGEVLGVNKINLNIHPGITGLVGPNGAGKSTLMNLLAGLIRPNRGTVDVLGTSPDNTQEFFRLVGYCTQFDSFPAKSTGWQFIERTLKIHGYPEVIAQELTARAIAKVSLEHAAHKLIDSYSKGMRQRIKLAQSFAHQPRVLILDEPLNGLDPMARVQANAIFREFADDGVCVLVSSHVLHEVDLISDQVVFLSNGYLVAEGDVSGIRGETGEPMQIFIRSHSAKDIAASVFDLSHVIEAQLHNDGGGLFVRTSDADSFFVSFNAQVLAKEWVIDAISPADETVEAVYRHLIVQGVAS